MNDFKKCPNIAQDCCKQNKLAWEYSSSSVEFSQNKMFRFAHVKYEIK